jgi:hypothetical protein
MWESRGIAPPFLTSALVGGGWSDSRPYRFNLSTHLIGGWVGPKAGLNAVEERELLPLGGIKPRPTILVARSYTDCAILTLKLTN